MTTTQQLTERQKELRSVVYRDCLSTLDQYLDDDYYDGKTFTLDHLIVDHPTDQKGVLACQFFLVNRLSDDHNDIKDLIELEMNNYDWLRREDKVTGLISYTKQ